MKRGGGAAGSGQAATRGSPVRGVWQRRRRVAAGSGQTVDQRRPGASSQRRRRVAELSARLPAASGAQEQQIALVELDLVRGRPAAIRPRPSAAGLRRTLLRLLRRHLRRAELSRVVDALVVVVDRHGQDLRRVPGAQPVWA